MIDYHSIEAYCHWKSATSGVRYRLPTEFEWEKAARGVDGRWYVWGDSFDPSYCCMFDSHAGRRLPAVVEHYPIDESVYGIRGLAGNMRDWTSSHFRDDWREAEDTSSCVLRGGCWNFFVGYNLAARRDRGAPIDRQGNLSFHLVRNLA